MNYVIKIYYYYWIIVGLTQFSVNDLIVLLYYLIELNYFHYLIHCTVLSLFFIKLIFINLLHSLSLFRSVFFYGFPYSFLLFCKLGYFAVDLLAALLSRGSSSAFLGHMCEV